MDIYSTLIIAVAIFASGIAIDRTLRSIKKQLEYSVKEPHVYRAWKTEKDLEPSGLKVDWDTIKTANRQRLDEWLTENPAKYKPNDKCGLWVVASASMEDWLLRYTHVYNCVNSLTGEQKELHEYQLTALKIASEK